MGKESIIKKAKCCFFCGSERDLELHHCIHGVANRKLADKHGLFVYLCPICHRGTDGVHGKNGHEKDVLLQQTAEWAWLEHNGYLRKNGVDPKGIDEWISIFGKNYL